MHTETFDREDGSTGWKYNCICIDCEVLNRVEEVALNPDYDWGQAYATIVAVKKLLKSQKETTRSSKQNDDVQESILMIQALRGTNACQVNHIAVDAPDPDSSWGGNMYHADDTAGTRHTFKAYLNKKKEDGELDQATQKWLFGDAKEPKEEDAFDQETRVPTTCLAD